jgi:hypothetical protein
MSLPLSFAWLRAGSSIDTRMAMIAITTKSSINVNRTRFSAINVNGRLLRICAKLYM